MKVAVLGCGPTGLLAAHACVRDIGVDRVDILSIIKKSPMFGCQYLHDEIPGLVVPQAPVYYSLEGTPEDYKLKVYGPDSKHTVSPEDLAENHTAWDIRYAYELLWKRYRGYMQHQVLGTETLHALVESSEYDLIISTIPRTLWAREQDHYNYSTQDVWAIGDAPERGQAVPFGPARDFTIICDGTRDVGWYRMAKVFGYTTIEWPKAHKPPLPNISRVRKPISTNAPEIDGVLFVGRYGEWKKGVLTSDAFKQVAEYLETNRSS